MAKATGNKNRQATAIKETEILESVEDLSLDTVSNNITATQVEVQRSLAGLSAKLSEQLQVLRKVEDAIALKRDELKSLYDIEANAIELDDLVAQIHNQREAWVQEQAKKQREFAELKAERDKQHRREEEEYQYRREQEQRKQEDAFASRMEQQERANKERQEQLDKLWSEREQELKKREQELADLRTQVAGIPDAVKKEVNAAVAIATNSVKKEYETKIILASKDTETAQKLALLEVASLKQTIEKLNQQVLDLKTELTQAHGAVQAISAKALESASGRSAMEALQKVLEKDQSSGRPNK